MLAWCLGYQHRKRPNPLSRSQTADIHAPSRHQISTLPKVQDEGEGQSHSIPREGHPQATPALKRLTIGFIRILLPGNWIQSEQSRHLEGPSIPPFIAHRYDFFGGSITTIVRRFRDRIPPHLAPPPSAGYGWSPARAIEYVLFRRRNHGAHEIRPVAIRTKGNQISSKALRTFHAMAKKGRHRHFASR